MLTSIKYHQIKHNLFEEVNVHPEILKNLEILHYHTENNLPVEKEVRFHECNRLASFHAFT